MPRSVLHPVLSIGGEKPRPRATVQVARKAGASSEGRKTTTGPSWFGPGLAAKRVPVPFRDVAQPALAGLPVFAGSRRWSVQRNKSRREAFSRPKATD